jgi:carbon starvation protein
MKAVLVLVLGFIVFFIGHRRYAGYIDARIIKADRKRAAPAEIYMDGVEFMPTSKNVLFIAKV